MHEHESLPGRLEACLSSDEMAHLWLLARGELIEGQSFPRGGVIEEHAMRHELLSDPDKCYVGSLAVRYRSGKTHDVPSSASFLHSMP
jgi:hypothetical protein